MRLFVFLFLVHFCTSEIWNWGRGDSGELADGTTSTQTTPQRLNSFSSLPGNSDFNTKIIKKLSCSNNHCLILTGFVFLFSTKKMIQFCMLLVKTVLEKLELEKEQFIKQFKELTILFIHKLTIQKSLTLQLVMIQVWF
jgi:hypothetical protein